MANSKRQTPEETQRRMRTKQSRKEGEGSRRGGGRGGERGPSLPRREKEQILLLMHKTMAKMYITELPCSTYAISISYNHSTKILEE